MFDVLSNKTTEEYLTELKSISSLFRHSNEGDREDIIKRSILLYDTIDVYNLVDVIHYIGILFLLKGEYKIDPVYLQSIDKFDEYYLNIFIAFTDCFNETDDFNKLIIAMLKDNIYTLSFNSKWVSYLERETCKRIKESGKCLMNN